MAKKRHKPTNRTFHTDQWVVPGEVTDPKVLDDLLEGWSHARPIDAGTYKILSFKEVVLNQERCAMFTFQHPKLGVCSNVTSVWWWDHETEEA